MSYTSQEVYDVAIVGFGPTGAVAAGLLGQYGIRTLVCDKQLEVYDKPRAISLDHEIARVFQQLGLTEKMAPFVEPFTDSVFYGVDGQMIKRMSTVPAPYPLSHTPSMVFSQPEIEKILRDYANSHANVDVVLGSDLIDLVQDDDHATLSLKNISGEIVQYCARYVIGCDGASSSVRDFVGIGLEDLGFDEPWLVIDVLVNEKGAAKLPSTSVQYCNPKRPATYLICPGMHRRWEISINPGEDPLDLASPSGAWRQLGPWISPEDGELWRQASYRFHALVAEKWRAGRVFISGDAAHQQPPFLGQGMCQGVRDVVNLCWRLKAVLRESATDSLLDGYGIERKAHVVALTSRIKGVGKIITERDFDKARQRDAHLLAECDGVVKPMPRQNIQPPLTGGLICSLPHPARGTIFPQPMILVGDHFANRMDEVLGTGWRLFFAPEVTGKEMQKSTNHHLPSLETIQLGSAQLKEVDGVMDNWFSTHMVKAALVRPDHYVYGAYENLDEMALALDDLRLN